MRFIDFSGVCRGFVRDGPCALKYSFATILLPSWPTEPASLFVPIAFDYANAGSGWLHPCSRATGRLPLDYRWR